MIQLQIYEDVSRFKKEVTPILEMSEQENNLLLEVLQFAENPLFMAVAKQDEEMVLIFLQTEEKQMIVAKSEAIKQLLYILT